MASQAVRSPPANTREGPGCVSPAPQLKREWSLWPIAKPITGPPQLAPLVIPVERRLALSATLWRLDRPPGS